jgi:hypothetical protein
MRPQRRLGCNHPPQPAAALVSWQEGADLHLSFQDVVRGKRRFSVGYNPAAPGYCNRPVAVPPRVVLATCTVRPSRTRRTLRRPLGHTENGVPCAPMHLCPLLRLASRDSSLDRYTRPRTARLSDAIQPLLCVDRSLLTTATPSPSEQPSPGFAPRLPTFSKQP